MTTGVQKFTPYERIALWEEHSQLCYHCRNRIKFDDMEADHLVPLSYEKKPKNIRESLLFTLMLDLSYPLRDWINIVPACKRCNGRKNVHLLPFQVIHGIHMETERLKPKIIAHSAYLASDYAMSAALASLEAAIDMGIVTTTKVHTDMVASGLWERIQFHRFQLGIPVNSEAKVNIINPTEMERVLDLFWENINRGGIARRVIYRNHYEEILQINVGDYSITYRAVDIDHNAVDIVEVVRMEDKEKITKENNAKFLLQDGNIDERFPASVK